MGEIEIHSRCGGYLTESGSKDKRKVPKEGKVNCEVGIEAGKSGK